MLAQTRLPSLLLQLPRLRSVAPGLATMSSATGTLTVQQPLNYRAGARVQPADGGQLEEVFEPATGTDRGKLRGLGELCACRARCPRLCPAHPGVTYAVSCCPSAAPAAVAELCLHCLAVTVLRAEISSFSVAARFWQTTPI